MGRVLGVLVGVVAGVAFGGSSLPAQSQTSRPDFSGTWTLTPAPGVPPDAPLWNEGVIAQGASKVNFSSAIPGWVKVLPAFQPSYWLDGQDSVSRRTDPRGTWKVVSQTQWDADALVIATTVNGIAGTFGRWQDFVTLSLNLAGNLIVVTDRAPMQPDVPRVVTRYAYKRKRLSPRPRVSRTQTGDSVSVLKSGGPD
jgi:hypothetical protein